MACKMQYNVELWQTIPDLKPHFTPAALAANILQNVSHPPLQHPLLQPRQQSRFEKYFSYTKLHFQSTLIVAYQFYFHERLSVQR